MTTDVLIPGVQEEMTLLGETQGAELIWCLSKSKDGTWWVIANDDKTITFGHPSLEAALEDLHAKQMAAETKPLLTIYTQPDGKYRIDPVSGSSIVDLETFPKVIDALACLFDENVHNTCNALLNASRDLSEIRADVDDLT